MSSDQPTERYSCPCIYCGRFVSWPYPRAGMEWHDQCEKAALRDEFLRDALPTMLSGGRR